MISFGRVIKLLSFSFLFVKSSIVFAIDLKYDLAMSLSGDDNADLVLKPANDEWIQTIKGTVYIVETSANLIANFKVSLTTNKYRNNQSKNSTIGNLSGTGKWIIQPNHLEWFLSEVYTQTVLDPLAPNIESNRQDTNAILTGPNYYWRLNANNNVNVEARIGSVNFENKIGDKTNVSTALRWLYKVNPKFNASLNSEISVVDYVENETNDNTQKSLFLGADYVAGRNIYKAEAGITQIDYTQKENQSGPRYLFSLKNQRTRNSSIQLTYQQNISDIGTKLISNLSNLDVPETAVNDSEVTSLSDIFTEDNIDLTYRKTSESIALVLSASDRKQTYNENNTLNRVVRRYSIKPTYHLSQISSIGLEAIKSITLYKDSAPRIEDVDYFYRLKYSYKLKKNIALNLNVESLKRESNDPLRDYKDNRVILTVKYSSK